MTLHSLNTTSILLRLSHLFGLGEDASLSSPVTVDLSTLFDSDKLKVTDVTEVSLTNNQDKASILGRRQRARVWHSTDGEAPHAWRAIDETPSDDTSVTLGPLEIKSFVLTVASKE